MSEPKERVCGKIHTTKLPWTLLLVPRVSLLCNATITISRKKRDELMYLASFSVCPVELVRLTLSLPATGCVSNLVLLEEKCLLMSAVKA